MKPQPLSVLICTYGRTALLAEAVESFCRQDYSDARELIIINDCPQQSLVCTAPGVTVINITTPFKHYSDKRNYALAQAKHPLVCLWDDDDIYLPSFLSSVVEKMHDDDKGMRLSSLMSWDGRFARVLAGSYYHTAVLRKSAVDAIGGFRAVEKTDSDFCERLVLYRFFHGKHHHGRDHYGPLMVYRRDDRTHMAAGDGGMITHADFMHAMNERIRGRMEPHGVVTITPSWSRDWVAFVAEHVTVSRE